MRRTAISVPFAMLSHFGVSLLFLREAIVYQRLIFSFVPAGFEFGYYSPSEGSCLEID